MQSFSKEDCTFPGAYIFREISGAPTHSAVQLPSYTWVQVHPKIQNYSQYPNIKMSVVHSIYGFYIFLMIHRVGISFHHFLYPSPVPSQQLSFELSPHPTLIFFLPSYIKFYLLLLYLKSYILGCVGLLQGFINIFFPTKTLVSSIGILVSLFRW